MHNSNMFKTIGNFFSGLFQPHEPVVTVDTSISKEERKIVFDAKTLRGKISNDLAGRQTPINYECKIVICGDTGVGKTTMLSKYQDNYFGNNTNYLPTVGVDFKLQYYNVAENQGAKVRFWDLGGQDKYEKIALAYLQKNDACILMYDVTDRHSFEKLEIYQEKLPQNMKVIVLANKCDLESKIPDLITDGQTYAKKIGAKFYELSLKDDNIREIIDTLVASIIECDVTDLTMVKLENLYANIRSK